jgi:hypothetical protein
MPRHTGYVAIALLAFVVSAVPAGAQGSLIRRNQVSAMPRFERISFADSVSDGGGSGAAIKSLEQIAVPMGFAVGVMRSWTLDVSAAFTTGKVEFTDGTTNEVDGISDVRVRLSGNIIGDGLVLSLGANIPTGATSLDTDQLTAVRALAAPAFGLNMPSIGFGPAGSAGLVASRLLGTWVGAIGASYEYRGKFSPIAALQAGAEPDFDPGDAVHLSAGLEGFVGSSRLSLQGGVDLYSEDLLTSPGATTSQSLKLGPVITAEAALHFGGDAIRDGRIYGAFRQRSAFERNGVTAEGSDGTYLNGGLDFGIAMGRSFDLHLAADGLAHSGLEIDDFLMTAKATSFGGQVGLRFRGTGGLFEPVARFGTGSIDPGNGSQTFTTLAGGVMVVWRF